MTPNESELPALQAKVNELSKQLEQVEADLARLTAPPKPAEAPVPCPFCGDPVPVPLLADGDGYYRVRCHHCAFGGRGSTRSAHDAVALWNRRAPCPSCADIGKRDLREARDKWRTRAQELSSVQSEVAAELRAMHGAVRWADVEGAIARLEGKLPSQPRPCPECARRCVGCDYACPRALAAEAHVSAMGSALNQCHEERQAAIARAEAAIRRGNEAASILRNVRPVFAGAVAPAIAKLEGMA